MTFQIGDYPDGQSNAEGSMSTLYDIYRWRVMNDLGRQRGKQLRANINAHLIACGSFAAIEAGMQPYEEELKALDGDAYVHHLQQLTRRLLEDATQMTRGFTEEVDREIRRIESEICLEALRRDMLTTHEIDISLCFLFGQFAYLEAQPEVEKLLTSRDPVLRRRALEVLVLYWGLSEHQETAFQFLSDPDPDCRKLGIQCLNPMRNILDDPPVLQAYAHIVINADEQANIRLFAYRELLIAAGYELDHNDWQEIERFLEDRGTIEQAPRIDWEIVRFFHEESNGDG